MKGRKTELIMLNISTFKALCMLSNSSKGKQTREYYVKMENVFLKYIDRKHQNIIATLEEEYKRKRELERHNLLKQHNKDTSCIYLLKLDIDMEKEDNEMFVKLGETDDIQTRIQSLQQEYKNSLLIDVFPCPRPHQFEQYLLKRPDISERRMNGTEIIHVSNDFTYEHLRRIIENNIDYFNNVPLYQKIQYEKVKNSQQYFRTKATLLESLQQANNETDKEFYRKQIEELKLEEVTITSEEPPYKEPESNRKVYKYDPSDLKTPIAIFNSLREASRSTNDPKIHDYHIRTACLENTMLDGHRWYYTDDQESPPESIPANDNTHAEPKANRRRGLVAKINKDKTHIIQVYSSIKSAATAHHIADCSLSCALNKDRNCAGYYWRMYNDCSDELKATYQRELPQHNHMSSSKRVEQVCPDTNEVIKTFSCIQDVCHDHRICHKTLNKLSKTGDIYKGFKWRIV